MKHPLITKLHSTNKSSNCKFLRFNQKLITYL